MPFNLKKRDERTDNGETTDTPAAEPVTAATPEGEVKAVAATPGKQRVRLSADIDHAVYVKMKTYSALTRRPIVAIIEDLIGKYCPV